MGTRTAAVSRNDSTGGSLNTARHPCATVHTDTRSHPRKNPSRAWQQKRGPTTGVITMRLPEPPRPPGLFDDPPEHRARPGDPRTSHAAARQLNPGPAIRRVVVVIASRGDHGATCDEVIRVTHGDRANTSRRITDGCRRGLLRDSGRERRSRAGRLQIVWSATASGLSLAARATAEEAGR